MATRSTIGYETPDGGYIGVYVHYDSYPGNIAPQLKQMSWEDVSLQVNRAIMQNGARCLDGCELETFNDGSPLSPTLAWPSCPEEYAYRKRLDGSVECLNRYHSPISLNNY
jgi:hypothetical protein